MFCTLSVYISCTGFLPPPSPHTSSLWSGPRIADYFPGNSLDSAILHEGINYSRQSIRDRSNSFTLSRLNNYGISAVGVIEIQTTVYPLSYLMMALHSG